MNFDPNNSFSEINEHPVAYKENILLQKYPCPKLDSIDFEFYNILLQEHWENISICCLTHTSTARILSGGWICVKYWIF